jgi:hypothetical protein
MADEKSDGNDRGEEKDRDDNQKRGDEKKRDDKNDSGDGPIGGRDLAWRAYLKLAATMLITLILFAAILRGCASCQQQNPITGEPTQQPAPPPGG